MTRRIEHVRAEAGPETAAVLEQMLKDQGSTPPTADPASVHTHLTPGRRSGAAPKVTKAPHRVLGDSDNGAAVGRDGAGDRHNPAPTDHHYGGSSAMACGVPVVGIADGAGPEVVGDRAGIFVAPRGNVETSLGDALTKLCFEPELRRSMGAARLDHYRSQWSNERWGEELETIITRWVR
ncbi:MAG: hypothetical protein ACRDRS_11205 [Pseudonocardiaceae bacterium]